MGGNINHVEKLAGEVRDYAEIRFDELKLKTVRGLSTAFSRFFSMLLIAGAAVIVFGLAEYALLQWLNSLLGTPWGTLIALGLAVMALSLLVAYRKRMFRDGFVKMLVGEFFEEDEDE